jgi:putative phosphoribosyl transferase
MVVYADRAEAGWMLAQRLAYLAGRDDVVVLALPRGGVPIGRQVAAALGAPLDIFIVRKIGVPGHEELAMGAIASGGTVIVNNDVVRELAIDKTTFDRVADSEQVELMRREHAYRQGRLPLQRRGKICILTDDGIATGASMLAAATALRAEHPQSIIVAAPVTAEAALRDLQEVVDKVVSLQSPEPFTAVGAWYRSFPQLTDDQVQSFLGNSRIQLAATQPPSQPPPAIG